nr:MAG: Zn finger protein [uncultured archaeon]
MVKKKRKRPVKHKRRPYTRKDGTRVKGTVVNPDVIKGKKTYWTNLYGSCGIDCYIKAENKTEAENLFKKIIKGDSEGIDLYLDDVKLKELSNIGRIKEVKEDEWQYNLLEQELKPFEYYCRDCGYKWRTKEQIKKPVCPKCKSTTIW